MMHIENNIKDYILCDDLNITKQDILNKYGIVSFAYKKKHKKQNDDEIRYDLAAVSKNLEPQYLKSDLILDDVFFLGTDTLMEIEEVLGVI